MSFSLYDRNECEVEFKSFYENKNDENLFYDDFHQNYMYVSMYRMYIVYILIFMQKSSVK